jgi:hypothetical protein
LLLFQIELLYRYVSGAGGEFTDWHGAELVWEGDQVALSAGQFQGEVIAAGDKRWGPCTSCEFSQLTHSLKGPGFNP